MIQGSWIPLRETKGSEGELAPIEHGLRSARMNLYLPCLRENLKNLLVITVGWITWLIIRRRTLLDALFHAKCRIHGTSKY